MWKSDKGLHRAVFWAFCFALLLGVRLCHKDVLWADEAYGLAAARRIMEGARLYRDVWFDKPPLYAWVYLLWGGRTGLPLRMAGAGFALACCVLAFLAARRLFGRREAWIAAAGMAFFLSFDHPVAIISLAPDFLLIPFALGVVWALAAERPRLAGLLVASGLLAHTKGLLLLPVALLWDPRRWKGVLLGFVPAVAGVWWLAQGWEEPVWLWGLVYAREGLAEHPLLEGIRRTANWAGFHAALILPSAGYFLAKEEKTRWRMMLWLALALGVVAAGFRFFSRYYLALLPVLVLTASRGLAINRRRWCAWFTAVLLVLPAVRFGLRHVRTLTGHPAAMRDLVLFEDCREAAGWIRGKARPGETLLVWGYRPELNVLAEMPGATPFLDSQPLTGVLADRHLVLAEPTAPEVAARNRRRLTRFRPDFIADGLGPLNPQLGIERYEDLQAWLRDYELAGHTRATRIYRRRTSQGNGHGP